MTKKWYLFVNLKKNVLLEGRISATAQQKITDDNVRIEELNKRNKEINENWSVTLHYSGYNHA